VIEMMREAKAGCLEDFLSQSSGFLLLNVLAMILYPAFLPILSISTTEDEAMTPPFF